MSILVLKLPRTAASSTMFLISPTILLSASTVPLTPFLVLAEYAGVVFGDLLAQSPLAKAVATRVTSFRPVSEMFDRLLSKSDSSLV